jgi:hypothetical protein
MAQSPDPLPREVLAAFERRQPIEAIRLLLRLRAGAAPAARTAARPQPPRPTASMPPAPPVGPARRGGLSPGEIPRSTSSFWAWVIVALVAYAAFRLMRG